MSNYSDDPLDFEDDYLEEGATRRATQPDTFSQSTRRYIPPEQMPDEPPEFPPPMPTARSTPPPMQRLPPELPLHNDVPPYASHRSTDHIDRPPVPLPVTPPPYTGPEPIAPRRTGQARRVRRDPRTSRRESGWYLPWWSLIIMLMLVGGAAVGAWVIVAQMGGNAPAGGQTPVVVVVTSTFTVGPPATLTPIPLRPTATSTAPLPTLPATPTLPPGDFVVGATVEVVGVGIQGLNVRVGPGLDAAIKFQGREKERFKIKEGPQTASGEEWWLILDPKDSSRVGWAARRFLTVVTP